MVETVFKTRCAVEKAIGHYIEAFYNPKRRHSALGFSSPIQFEREALRLVA
jgi:transposase InsO family protein